MVPVFCNLELNECSANENLWLTKRNGWIGFPSLLIFPSMWNLSLISPVLGHDSHNLVVREILSPGWQHFSILDCFQEGRICKVTGSQGPVVLLFYRQAVEEKCSPKVWRCWLVSATLSGGVGLNRMSLLPSYYCLGHRPGRRPGLRLGQQFGQRFVHRCSQLPIVPYVYREAIEPHFNRQSSHTWSSVQQEASTIHFAQFPTSEASGGAVTLKLV